MKILSQAISFLIAAFMSIFFAGSVAWAQGQQPENPSPSPTVSERIPIDRLAPGWNTNRIRHGLGFSSSFLSASSTFIYERYSGETSWSFYAGLNKSADSFVNSETTSTTNTSPTATTTSKSNSGAKNPIGLSLGTSYNMRIYRNDWIQLRWGMFGGVDYFMKTDYDTGSRTESTSSAAAGTISISESAYGKVEVERSPVFKLGPVVDSFFYIRWLPQLAVGLQGGMLYATDLKTTTSTKTRTRTYQNVNGVDQTATSDTSSSTKADAQAGSSISTFAVNGTTFNLFGNFVLRYVW